MQEKSSIRSIKSIHYRRILNSHVEFTTEFVVELDDGSIGIGSAPKGETTSVYEKDEASAGPKKIVQTLVRDHLLNVPLTQREFDNHLQEQAQALGRSNCYALSLAFFDANERAQVKLQQASELPAKPSFPHICLNVLNGGRHAYTNPVLSDFPEFLLISKSNLLDEIINDHNELQRRIKEKLAKCEKTIVNGNVVNKLDAPDNRAPLEFIFNITHDLSLTTKYDLMIDASAGDLWTGSRYKFSLTDDTVRTGSEMCDYWNDLISTYKIRFLEDPFQEKDFNSWRNLTRVQKQCKVIGDNLYASNPSRIREGATREYTHGVIIKPDQAGTVTTTIEAIKTAQNNNQIAIASHRSVSTESTFLSILTSRHNINYIKIGPLATDYSAIIRLNELIRLSGTGYE